jgi:hypothetical protein
VQRGGRANNVAQDAVGAHDRCGCGAGGR